MAYFPLFVDMEEKEILVIGGGTVAARRIKTLLSFGCRITVVSPVLKDELCALKETGSIIWHPASYESTCLGSSLFFVLAAADKKTNARVVSDCRRLHIPVNDASSKENSNFYFPAIIKDERATIGLISSEGNNHHFTAEFAAWLREQIKTF